MTITFGSVCSGIEAASVAWHPLGWRAVWLAEIEPFPAKVLHHHYGSGHPHHMPSPDDAGLSADDIKDRRASLKAVSGLPLVPLTGDAPPNLGDMTKIAAMVRSGTVAAPDVLVGGTPCQAFSIAGLRNSLTDSRGQLSLSFVDLANVIDAARLVRGEPAAVIVWENVPGVLNTKDNAFGCFLAALAGEDEPLQPSGGKWTNAGCVLGPQRTIAWRVLDAQYFGVAQRRRRVFVIASAREGFDPTEVLFEFDGVRRDIAPSREAREDTATGATGSTSGSGGQSAGRVDIFGGNGDVGGNGTDGRIGSHWDGDYPHPTLNQSHNIGGVGQSNQEIFSQRGAYLVPDSPVCAARMVAFGEYVDDGTASTMKQRDYKDATDLVAYGIQSTIIGRQDHNGPQGTGVSEDVSFTLPKADRHAVAFGIPGNWIGRKPENGGNAVEPMHGVAPCLTSTDRHGVAYSVALRGREGGATAELGDEVAGCLRASTGGGDKAHVLAPIAFSSKDYGGDAAFDLAPTLRSGNHDKSHANGGQPPAIAFDSRQDPVSSTEVFGALGSSSPKAQAVCFAENNRGEIRLQYGDGQITGPLSTGGGKPGQGFPAVAFRACGQDGFTPREVSPPICSSDGGGAGVPTAMTPTMAVRRLTPRECERLQAFNDDYTLIPGKPLAHVDPAKLDMNYIKYLMRGGVRTFEECISAASDGPRYKALGNSMCVFNMRWIGRRIDAVISPTKEQ